MSCSLIILLAFWHSVASLRFQPTKRPQLSTRQTKTKSSLAKPPIPAPQAAATPLDPAFAAARATTKTTLADWTVVGETDDVNGFYAGEKRQRGGRKKRKKNKEASHVAQNWDDIYDPTRPTSYEDYKHSDEQIAEIQEWKDNLYAHRSAKRHSSDSESSDSDPRPLTSKVILKWQILTY